MFYGVLLKAVNELHQSMYQYCLFVSEELKNRLYEKQLAELEKLNKEHEAHMQAARMELERAVEISKQKV